jgi:hypothetical protein
MAGGMGVGWAQDRLGFSLSSAKAMKANLEKDLGSEQDGIRGISGSRVVHAHAPPATSWNGSDPQYWNYIDQSVVNEMVDRGMMTLTDTSSVADAWEAILPNYQPGQGIAIKINLNHSNSCSDADGEIIALIEPVNAVIRGLKEIGVVESDIWIYDAKRHVPIHFSDGCLYDGVQFFDMGCAKSAGFMSTDPNAYVTFSPPAGIPMPPSIKITDVLINATYLINLPIMRIHSNSGVTLSMKNHFGSIDNPGGLHHYIFLDGQYYRSDYSPIVDVCRNPHILEKTVLTIGDGLIGGRRWSWPDAEWTTFGGEVPNSLFFSRDPVSIDCVMSDMLAAETSVPAGSDDYLRYASNIGLGVYERGNPWQLPFGSGYNEIEYLRLEYPFDNFVYLPLIIR